MEKVFTAIHSQTDRAASPSSATSLWLALPFAAFALSACVTINIYFPAAAAEKAADKIIEEVWQIPKNATETMNKPSAPEAKTKEPPTKDTK